MACALMPCYLAPLPSVNWHPLHGARFSGSVNAGGGVKKLQHSGRSRSSRKRWSHAGPSDHGSGASTCRSIETVRRFAARVGGILPLRHAHDRGRWQQPVNHERLRSAPETVMKPVSPKGCSWPMERKLIAMAACHHQTNKSPLERAFVAYLLRATQRIGVFGVRMASVVISC